MSASNSGNMPNKNKKLSRQQVVAAKRKIFEAIKEMVEKDGNFLKGQKDPLYAVSPPIISNLINNLKICVDGEKASTATKKELQRAQDHIASGCGIIHRERTQGIGGRKPGMKDYMQAAASLHQGLLLVPTESSLTNDAEKGRELLLLEAYKALATLYSRDHLNNQQRFEMYNMLWLRKYAQVPTTDREVQYREVQYRAQALFESYGRAMNEGMKRLAKMAQSLPGSQSGMPKHMSKLMVEIRRARARAEDCLLAEALALYQTRPRFFSVLLSQYKEIKISLNRDYSAFDTFVLLSPEEFKVKTEKTKKQNADKANATSGKKESRPFTNVLTKVMLDLKDNCLRARSQFKKGQIIFYEPVIASSWTETNQHCGQCVKPIPWGGIPCVSCSRVSFCSERCVSLAEQASAPFKRHTQLNCDVFSGAQLSKNQALVYDLVANSGAKLEELPGAILNTDNTFKDLKSVLNSNSTFKQLPLCMPAVLLYKRLNALPEIKQNAVWLDIWLVTETEHLLAIYSSKGDCVRLRNLLYNLLYFFKITPQANIPLSRGKKKQNDGFALGAFGGGFLEYSCTPNTRRQINPKTGSIEYVATQMIKPGEILTTAWSTKLTALNAAQRKAELKKLKETYNLECKCAICKAEKAALAH